MAKSWLIDPKTGDYVMNNGSPVETDSLTVPAYFRLKTRRLQWLYAPSSTFGSDFHLVKKRRTTEDASFLESIAAQALQPILDDSRADSITVTTTSTARHGIGMQASIVSDGGKEDVIDLPQV
jgi:phage gp46-like protein